MTTTNNMNGYKVTYYDKEMDIVSVLTYHNVVDQEALLHIIANNIVTLDLQEVVKCERDGESLTECVNVLVKKHVKDIRKADREWEAGKKAAAKLYRMQHPYG
jgi:hypothetical protein